MLTNICLKQSSPGNRRFWTNMSYHHIYVARQNLHKLSEVAQLSKLQHHQEGLTKRLAADSKQVHDVLMPPNHLDKGIFTVCKTRVARDICCRLPTKVRTIFGSE